MFTKPSIHTYDIERDYALGEKITYNKELNRFEKTENFKGKIIYVGTVKLKKEEKKDYKVKKVCFGDLEDSKESIEGNFIVKIYKENNNLCFETKI
ncbi:hypothetical protein ND861_19125 [Leptospira sp. 2 VSF19]|uniref:Uncharacterized protein n=1 Tax=Leptospira soteropolitanensis TaxID=2950025 RepID=A0AAW5VRY3_9LEPT|nr:hypothetical protein [Leptospira soteropolitanensis]MCW7502376.1 hypothetical protein [Leptospira soteropolitanensis]MCW7524613.1 hypothetical protein [Leptospira soteropolitanensis]MCW7528477.1 hypothetical protein [Leptospira soteropolitanensis]MCW7532343.1 hypothetical protein [Leptospira soteropolitanensis]